MHEQKFPHPDELVSTKDLCKLTNLTRRFWEARRMSGETPPFIKLSEKCVRYRWGDVQQWLEERKRINTID